MSTLREQVIADHIKLTEGVDSVAKLLALKLDPGHALDVIAMLFLTDASRSKLYARCASIALQNWLMDEVQHDIQPDFPRYVGRILANEPTDTLLSVTGCDTYEEYAETRQLYFRLALEYLNGQKEWYNRYESRHYR